MKDKIEALQHALGVIASKRVGSKTAAYLAALDDIEICLLASIERLKTGEQMESVAIVQA